MELRNVLCVLFLVWGRKVSVKRNKKRLKEVVKRETIF